MLQYSVRLISGSPDVRFNLALEATGEEIGLAPIILARVKEVYFA